MSLPFGPPVPVSALIRSFRWGLFLAGFIYARGKQKLYNVLEARHRDQEAKLKVIRDQAKAIERKKIANEEKKAIERLERGCV